jgi:hypothetical protein
VFDFGPYIPNVWFDFGLLISYMNVEHFGLLNYNYQDNLISNMKTKLFKVFNSMDQSVQHS